MGTGADPITRRATGRASHQDMARAGGASPLSPQRSDRRTARPYLSRQTAEALERLARVIFRAWFVDFEPVKTKAAGADSFPSMPQHVFDALPTRFVDSEIGPVPEGWEVKDLSTVFTLVSGGTPKRSDPSYWNGDVPWYSVKPESTEGGRRGSVLKWPEGAPVNLG